MMERSTKTPASTVSLTSPKALRWLLKPANKISFSPPRIRDSENPEPSLTSRVMAKNHPSLRSVEGSATPIASACRGHSWGSMNSMLPDTNSAVADSATHPKTLPRLYYPIRSEFGDDESRSINNCSLSSATCAAESA
jgi:hypothetical protein